MPVDSKQDTHFNDAISSSRNHVFDNGLRRVSSFRARDNVIKQIWNRELLLERLLGIPRADRRICRCKQYADALKY